MFSVCSKQLSSHRRRALRIRMKASNTCQYLDFAVPVVVALCCLTLTGQMKCYPAAATFDLSQHRNLSLSDLIPEQLLSMDGGSEVNLLIVGEELPFVDLKSRRRTITIRIFANMTTAGSESQLRDLLSQVYSNMGLEGVLDCNRLYTIVHPQAEKQFATILKWVGGFEHERYLSPSTMCAPTIFISWPSRNANTSVEDLEASLRKRASEDPDDRHFPYWSSNIYLLLPRSRNASVYQFDFYELFSWNANAKDFIMNPVTVNGEFVKSRHNLMGNEIRVTGMGEEEQKLGPLRDRRFVKLSRRNVLLKGLSWIGIGESVMEFLTASLNFSIKLVPGDDWLTEPVNDTWIGIGKILMERSAHVSVDESTFIPFRAKYLTLLVPIFLDRTCVWFRQPPASYVRNLFVQPFSISLWMAIIGLCTFVATFLACLMSAMGKSRRLSNFIVNEAGTASTSHKYKGTGTGSLSIGSTALWFTSFMTIQGWYKVPDKTWLRIIFFSGSAMGFIFYTAYSATLVSQFASSAKPIKTLEDFLRSDFMLYGDAGSPVVKNVFKGSLTHGSLSHKVTYTDRAFLMNQTMGFVNGVPFSEPTTQNSEHSAYISFTDQFYTYARNILPVQTADRLLCREMTEISAMQVPFRSGMIVPKNSPLKEYFNRGIMNYYEVGLFFRDFKLYVNSYRPTCDLERGNERRLIETVSNGLSLADTFTAFVIIAIGAGTALLLLLTEIMVAHFGQFAIKARA